MNAVSIDALAQFLLVLKLTQGMYHRIAVGTELNTATETPLPTRRRSTPVMDCPTDTLAVKHSCTIPRNGLATISGTVCCRCAHALVGAPSGVPYCTLDRLPDSVLGRARLSLQVELVPTACYGIRVYTNTSWLANHVDTRATHAVSVIMQVDQVSTAKRRRVGDK